MKVLILTKFEYLDWLSTVTHGQDVHYICDKDYVLPSYYDVGISFMWTNKVPVEHIKKRTWINFHPAPLPEYKGRNLCYHAIMNGEKTFGATAHYMDENFDTGAIINVLKFPILGYDTAGDIYKMAIETSKDLFKLYFPRIIAGETFVCDPNVGGRYYSKNAITDKLDMSNCGAYIKLQIRAVSFGDFYPKIDIDGVTYKIVKDE